MTAPIIITADMGKTDQAWANGLRRAHYPAERNFVDAHITLFRHLPPSHLPEIKSRLAGLVKDYPAPAAYLCDVMLLGKAVAFRVDSPELLAMRDELADSFRGLLIPQDQAIPKLHMTILNKVESPVAKALHTQLLETFRTRPLAISGLSAFYYRNGPWEHIGRWAFRG
jgi:hypothetical protein